MGKISEYGHSIPVLMSFKFDSKIKFQDFGGKKKGTGSASRPGYSGRSMYLFPVQRLQNRYSQMIS